MPKVLTPAMKAAMQGDWAELVGPTRTEVHIQIQGDTIGDPAPWVTALLQLLQSAGQPNWAAQPFGSAPVSGALTPIPHAEGHWDGGVVAVAATPEAALALARCLNEQCIPGASGSSRLALSMQHDYAEMATTRRRRSGKAGRGARPAGRPSAH